MLDKTRRQKAFLAGGKLDAVLAEQIGADFLALTVAEVTLQADVNLQIVAVDASRRHQARQGLRAKDHASTRLMGAIAGADPDRFLSDERSVLDRHYVAPQRFAHERRSRAPGAREIFYVRGHDRSRGGRHTSPVFRL